MPNRSGKGNSGLYLVVGAVVVLIIFGLWFFSRQKSRRRRPDRPDRPDRPERPSRPGEDQEPETDDDSD